MKTTKILPWIARKAGVPQARAEQLWAEAIRYATDHTGWVGTSEYWEAALDRWMSLIEDEKLVSASAAEPGKSATLARSPLSLMVPPTSRDASVLGPKVA